MYIKKKYLHTERIYYDKFRGSTPPPSPNKTKSCFEREKGPVNSK